MANSKYEYVKDYELDDRLLPGCWMIVRLVGRAFTRYPHALAACGTLLGLQLYPDTSGVLASCQWGATLQVLPAAQL